MTIQVNIDVFDNSSTRAGARKVGDLSDTYVEPAVLCLLYDFAAPAVRERMVELVHDETDNPNNTGDLKRAIAAAQIEYVSADNARISIRKTFSVDPLKEKEWGDRMHGSTPPPHDFTRENQEAATENAQEYWDKNIKSGII